MKSTRKGESIGGVCCQTTFKMGRVEGEIVGNESGREERGRKIGGDEDSPTSDKN